MDTSLVDLLSPLILFIYNCIQDMVFIIVGPATQRDETGHFPAILKLLESSHTIAGGT